MRPVNELIWHCTATPEGRETSAAEIDSWHKARGWSGIGYHKVVHLDGTVSQGRPESRVGAHVENHNTGTIGYVYVGGTERDSVKRAKDTRTPAQKRTMERLTREAIARYGLTRVSGHSDYANKACPCFNARAEYAHLLSPHKRPNVIPTPPTPRPQPDDPGPPEPAPAPKPKTGITEGAAVGGGLGIAGILSQVWDALSQAPDAILQAAIGAAQRPTFWVFLAVVGAAAFIWWRRHNMKKAA